MCYLLGIDVGTSGTKSVLFDDKGRKIKSSMQEYDILQNKNGWAEQDPNTWWNAVVITIKNVLQSSGINPESIASVGIAGQMHGLVMLDEFGEVIRNAILWCDGRTSKQCKEITQTIGYEKLIEVSANPALTGFTAGKILWVRDNEPENYKRCKKILLPKDYIRFKLTGVYGTDFSDASGTNLLDVPNRKWSDFILSELKIDNELLPPLYESCEVAGYINASAQLTTGLTIKTPVVAGAGDNAAAAIGTGVVANGKAFTTIGTSGVVFVQSDKAAIDKKGRIHTFCSAIPKTWTMMSCTLAAGMSLKWFRDVFCDSEIKVANELNVDPYVLMDNEAKLSPIGSNKLIFLPYLMGERSPLLDENARGAFIGLSAIHKKSDMIRAIMEGVAFSQKQCFDLICEQAKIDITDMIVCGGGARSLLWKQILADVYGCKISVSNASAEGPALGAAILAGVGCGVFESVESACEAIISVDEDVEPNQEANCRYKAFYQLYIEAYPALKKTFGLLSQLQ